MNPSLKEAECYEMEADTRTRTEDPIADSGLGVTRTLIQEQTRNKSPRGENKTKQLGWEREHKQEHRLTTLNWTRLTRQDTLMDMITNN